MATREGVYVPGDYYALCDICGFKHRRSEMSLDWLKRLVCSKDLDERNPQELIQPRPERQNVVDARYAAPVFVDEVDGSTALVTDEDELLVTEGSADWLAA